MNQSHAFESKLKSVIADVPDFPKEGILFKDITPIFRDAALCKEIANEFVRNLTVIPDAICVIESRGFFFGMLIAQQLQIPLIPIRKKGKLPSRVRAYEYDLEYGSAILEIQMDVLQKDWNVLIHDDVLATGGTAKATAELVLAEGAQISGFCFLVSLDFLNGTDKLKQYGADLLSLVQYS